jgi:phage FluMu protein Com
VTETPKVDQWQAVQCRRCGAVLASEGPDGQLSLNRLHVADAQVTWSDNMLQLSLKCRHCGKIATMRRSGWLLTSA